MLCLYCSDPKYGIEHMRCSATKLDGNIRTMYARTNPDTKRQSNFDGEYESFLEGGIQLAAYVPAPGAPAPKGIMTQILEELKKRKEVK